MTSEYIRTICNIMAFTLVNVLIVKPASGGAWVTLAGVYCLGVALAGIIDKAVSA